MVLEYDNFISEIICDRLIKISYRKLNKAEVLGEEIKDYRTANSCWLNDDDDNIVIEFRQKISELVNYILKKLNLI